MKGPATLRPRAGLIVGWTMPAPGQRPARIVATLDGAATARRLAEPVPGRLAAAAELAPPPCAGAFAFRLPRGAAGRRLLVMADGAPILTHDFADDRALARYREGSDMADIVRIEGLRFEAGRFRATVTDDGAGAAPQISLRLRGEVLARAALSPAGAGRWRMEVEAPASAFGDGVAVIEFTGADGARLAVYTVAAGAALAGDLAAEVASLRAELDLLKRAFREAISGGVIARDEWPLIVAEVLAEVDSLLEIRDKAERAAAAMPDPDEEDEPLWDVRE